MFTRYYSVLKMPAFRIRRKPIVPSTLSVDDIPRPLFSLFASVNDFTCTRVNRKRVEYVKSSQYDNNPPANPVGHKKKRIQTNGFSGVIFLIQCYRVHVNVTVIFQNKYCYMYI